MPYEILLQHASIVCDRRFDLFIILHIIVIFSTGHCISTFSFTVSLLLELCVFFSSHPVIIVMHSILTPTTAFQFVLNLYPASRIQGMYHIPKFSFHNSKCDHSGTMSGINLFYAQFFQFRSEEHTSELQSQR